LLATKTIVLALDDICPAIKGNFKKLSFDQIFVLRSNFNTCGKMYGQWDFLEAKRMGKYEKAFNRISSNADVFVS
jgi:hypothetical protein